MVETLYSEGAILKCIQTFDYKGKAVPAGKEYKVIKNEGVPIDEDKPHVVQDKNTLELQEENPPERVCKNPVVIGSDIADYFKLV